MTRLNPRQREAVRYIDGPLLVLAGAGSGKTSVITEKIAWLVNTCGIKASRIAAVTFTELAASELLARVARGLVQGEAVIRDPRIEPALAALGAQIAVVEAQLCLGRDGNPVLSGVEGAAA